MITFLSVVNGVYQFSAGGREIQYQSGANAMFGGDQVVH
jgi:hypothetical protein